MKIEELVKCEIIGKYERIRFLLNVYNDFIQETEDQVEFFNLVMDGGYDQFKRQEMEDIHNRILKTYDDIVYLKKHLI